MLDTRAAIKKQFMAEYGKKNFALISVKGLCAATPVARTTFYAYFSNTNDVKEEIEDELVCGLQGVADRSANGDYPHMEFAAFLDKTQKYIQENWNYFYAFLIQQPDLRFITKWKEAVKANFGKRYPEKQGIRNYGIIAEIVGSAVIGAYTYWMMHPEEVDTEEIKRIISDTLDSITDII